MLMNDKKCRIINFRAFAFGGIVMFATIFFAFMCFDSLWYILPLSIVFCAGVIYFCFRKNFAKLIYFCAVMLLSIGVLLLSIFTYNDFSVNGQKAKFDCRVDSIYSTYETSVSVIVSNVKINDKNVSGKALVTVYGTDEMNVGDVITFESVVKSYDVFDLVKNNFSFYKSNIKYKLSVNVEKLKITSGKLTWVEKYKETTKSNLTNAMGNDIGGVCYALLFGDKTLIDGDIYNLFRASGTAHLLAISGLHISIIISIIYFLVSKLKIKHLFKFLIMVAFLSVYCYLCDFAISVCRASIMGLVLIGSKLIGKRYDSLNALGFAGMIILVFSPLSIFSAGFLLSFAAVLAIILFAKMLDRVKFPNGIIKKLITTMYITTVVTIFTYPITASFFREVAIYSVFANLIVIPLFTVGFVCVFCFHLLAYVGLGFLLNVPKIIFNFIFAINNWFVNLPLSTIKVAGVTIIVAILIYLMFFILSRFIMLKFKIKAISCFVIFFICATIMLGDGIIGYNTSYAAIDNYNYSAVFVNQNKNYIVSPRLSSTYSYNTKQDLKKKNILSLDGIVFTNEDKFEVKLLQNFMEDFGSPMIYVPSGHSSIANLASSKICFIEYDEGVLLGGSVYLSIDNGLTSLVVCDTSFAFAGKKYNITDFTGFADYLIYSGQMQSDTKNIVNDTQYIKLG